MSGITTANLTDTVGGHTFTVSGWTGSGSLTAPWPLADTVTATKSANITLTNTSLSSGTHVAELERHHHRQPDRDRHQRQSVVHHRRQCLLNGPTNLTATGTVNAIFYGGTGGHDTLTVAAAGSGNNILIGNGAGDTLTDNGSGRNILIGGGAGGDTFTGNGNDILVSGTTTYDSNTAANIAALDAILAEWTSGDTYATKISKINVTGVGAGNAYKLNSSTITQDTHANTLKDGGNPTQNNWFLSWAGDSVTKKANETNSIL